MDLPDTTAFVSGASRGLGKHLAGQLTRRGASVYAGARKPGTLDTSTGVIVVQLDITDPASVTAAAAAAADTTLLIDGAGVLTATSLLTGDRPGISAGFGTNFYGTLATALAFAGPIQGYGGGSMVTAGWQRAGRRRLDGRPLTAIVTMLAGAVIGGEAIPHAPYLLPAGHRARRDHPGRDNELPMRTAGRCADPLAKLYRRRRLQEERRHDRRQNPSGLPDQVHAARRGGPVLHADLRRR
jgi:NAD(P)-dependent dehydrogenase (short-subunit alcohol dehydrogenase family)